MMLRRAIKHVVPAWPFLVLLCACQGGGVDRYLHPNFTVVWPPPQELRGSEIQPITPQQASWFAVEHLKETGVSDIVICEVRWIAAPLGGYLVDAQGMLNLNDCVYTSFRVGIRDGTEEIDGANTAGEEFVFIALGKDSAGDTAWFPPPGPDWSALQGEAIPDELLCYEFLLEREQFESLAEQYN